MVCYKNKNKKIDLKRRENVESLLADIIVQVVTECFDELATYELQFKDPNTGTLLTNFSVKQLQSTKFPELKLCSHQLYLTDVVIGEELAKGQFGAGKSATYLTNKNSV